MRRKSKSKKQGTPLFSKFKTQVQRHPKVLHDGSGDESAPSPPKNASKQRDEGNSQGKQNGAIFRPNPADDENAESLGGAYSAVRFKTGKQPLVCTSVSMSKKKSDPLDDRRGIMSTEGGSVLMSRSGEFSCTGIPNGHPRRSVRFRDSGEINGDSEGRKSHHENPNEARTFRDDGYDDSCSFDEVDGESKTRNLFPRNRHLMRTRHKSESSGDSGFASDTLNSKSIEHIEKLPRSSSLEEPPTDSTGFMYKSLTSEHPIPKRKEEDKYREIVSRAEGGNDISGTEHFQKGRGRPGAVNKHKHSRETNQGEHIHSLPEEFPSGIHVPQGANNYASNVADLFDEKGLLKSLNTIGISDIYPQSAANSNDKSDEIEFLVNSKYTDLSNAAPEEAAGISDICDKNEQLLNSNLTEKTFDIASHGASSSSDIADLIEELKLVYNPNRDEHTSNKAPHEVVDTDDVEPVGLTPSPRDEVGHAQGHQSEEISTRGASDIDDGPNINNENPERSISGFPEELDHTDNDEDREEENPTASLPGDEAVGPENLPNNGAEVPGEVPGNGLSDNSSASEYTSSNPISDMQLPLRNPNTGNNLSDVISNFGNSLGHGRSAFNNISNSPGHGRSSSNNVPQNRSELVVNQSSFLESYLTPRQGPAFAEYETKKERFKSFGGKVWPWAAPTITEIVLCGFFYKGPGDRTQCYMCGIILFMWEPSDYPLTEHKKHSGGCLYIRSLKSLNKRTLSEEIDSAMFTIVRLGYDKDIVQRAVEELDLKGKPIPKSREILDEVFIISDSENSFEESSIPSDSEGATGFDPSAFYEAPSDSDFQVGPWEKDETWQEEMINSDQDVVVDNFDIVFGDADHIDLHGAYNPNYQAASNVDNQTGAFDDSVYSLLNKVDDITQAQAEAAFSEQDSEDSEYEEEDEIDGIPIEPETKDPSQIKEVLQELRAENEELRMWLRCKVCMENEATQLYTDCGHLSVCLSCSAQLRDCPICRKKIKGAVTVFVSSS